MKVSPLFCSLASVVALVASKVSAQSYSSIPTIEAKGQHFFYSNNGTEFFIRGVAYQQDVSSNGTIDGAPTTYTDPLADVDGCKRDIPLMTQIRTNAIRVYAVDPTQNHDECMSMLADAGIYLILDLSEPSQSINRNTPAWDVALYQRYISVIDAFQKYNNVIGFFAGNEVSNSYNTTEASAFVRAAVRDSKAYIKNNGYRSSLGVGYATYDGPIRDELAQYFNCGDQSSAIDFWGYNVYSWCGNSNYVQSGYQARTDFFRDYSVPIFFAEYGCNTIDGAAGRKFTEVQAIYGDQMTPVWSGAIVYMWFQEANDYGLVSVSGSSASPLPDFTALSSQLAKISPSMTAMSDYSPTNSPTSCPSVFNSSMAGEATASESAWLATASPLPPSPNPALCACEMETLSCVSTSDDQSGYGDLFGFICGQMPDACKGIDTNATSGVYGGISQCSPQQQLSWVMNKYYLAQSGSNQASACDFNGQASTKQASQPSGSCASLVQALNSNGMGTVPTPTGNSAQQSSAAGGSGGSGSGSGSGSSSSSKGAAAMQGVPSVSFGAVSIGLYVAGAVLTGAGMILL